MDRTKIDIRLRMHIVNICLAAVAGRENDLRECKGLLLDEVERIITDASADAVNEYRGDLRA